MKILVINFWMKKAKKTYTGSIEFDLKLTKSTNHEKSKWHEVVKMYQYGPKTKTNICNIKKFSVHCLALGNYILELRIN